MPVLVVSALVAAALSLGHFPSLPILTACVGIGFLLGAAWRKAALKDWADRFRFAEEAANFGTWEWDPVSRKLVTSARAKSMLGYPSDESEDDAVFWSALIHPDDVGPTTQKWMEAMEKPDRAFEAECRLKHADGSWRWVLSRGRSRVSSHGLIGMVGAQIDITDKKTIEHESRGKEAKLIQLTTELKKSNADLERFAYIASHDLKEPLRMITTYLGLLSRDSDLPLNAKERTYLGFAMEGAKRLNGLVDSLLRFSRIGVVKGEFGRVSLNEVFDEVRENLRTQIAESGAEFSVGPLSTIHADRTQISQLMQNLLSNALKFRTPGKAPVIQIVSEDSPTETVLVFSDNGVGIKETDQDKIFEIFRRLHPRAKYPGDGIGLAACKKIVESHGGRIWVTSEAGKGAQFHCALPHLNSDLAS